MPVRTLTVMADDQPVESIPAELAPDDPQPGTPPAEQIDPLPVYDRHGGKWTYQDCGHWHREYDGELEECEGDNGPFNAGGIENLGYGPPFAHPPTVYEDGHRRYEKALHEVLAEHPEWRSPI